MLAEVCRFVSRIRETQSHRNPQKTADGRSSLYKTRCHCWEVHALLIVPCLKLKDLHQTQSTKSSSHSGLSVEYYIFLGCLAAAGKLRAGLATSLIQRELDATLHARHCVARLGSPHGCATKSLAQIPYEGAFVKNCVSKFPGERLYHRSFARFTPSNQSP